MQSLRHLRAGCRTLTEHCVRGITANTDHLRARRRALHRPGHRPVPAIGYEQSSAIAAEALRTRRPIAELVLERGLLNRAELDRLLAPANLVGRSAPRPPRRPGSTPQVARGCAEPCATPDQPGRVSFAGVGRYELLVAQNGHRRVNATNSVSDADREAARRSIGAGVDQLDTAAHRDGAGGGGTDQDFRRSTLVNCQRPLQEGAPDRVRRATGRSSSSTIPIAVGKTRTRTCPACWPCAGPYLQVFVGARAGVSVHLGR